MSNGKQHDHDPLPVVVVGGLSGQLKGGRHIVTPAHTPMSNLLLTLLEKFGVQQTSFGDSTANRHLRARSHASWHAATGVLLSREYGSRSRCPLICLAQGQGLRGAVRRS